MTTKLIDDFPDLWPAGTGLKLVNKDSFDPTKTMQNLDWSRFGAITNGNAIRARQDTIKIFLNSKKLRECVKKSSSESATDYGRDFFNKYGSRSAFMKKTKRISEALQSAIKSSEGKLSTDMYPRLLDTLVGNIADAKAMEDAVTKAISPEIEKVYSYSGIVATTSGTKRISGQAYKNVKAKGYGYRNYAFHETDGLISGAARSIIDWYEDPVPNGFWKKIGYALAWTLGLLVRIPSTIILSFIEKNRNDMLYTNKVPYTVMSEINNLHSNFAKTIHSRISSSLLELGIDKATAEKVIHIKTEFQFSLNPDTGFIVRLIDAKIAIDHRSFKKAIKTVQVFQRADDLFLDGIVFEEGVSFYSFIKRKVYEFRARNLAIESAKKALRLPLHTAFEHALIESKELLGNGKNTMLEETYEKLMDEVKYSSVKNAIAGMGLSDQWDEVLAFRKAVEDLMSKLKMHLYTAETVMKTLSKYKDLPWCFPTVLDDNKNVVSFNNLVPLHLIGRKDTSGTKELKANDLRLITGLPELNGRMISITGKNGGGKTATEVEMINALYQAHTGLPVFAEEFSFNAKDAIAMVFVERGNGSMLELLMKKLTTIAEEVEKNPVNKIVIVIDELLTGTQEDTGFDIGRRYLEMLARKGCSVMFVTQITELAVYSRDYLGALCFYFDNDGTMQPGIGKGNAYTLAKDVGLLKYLPDDQPLIL